MGTTVLTVTARDAENNTASATLTVTFMAPGAATLISPTGTIATRHAELQLDGR